MDKLSSNSKIKRSRKIILIFAGGLILTVLAVIAIVSVVSGIKKSSGIIAYIGNGINFYNINTGLE